MTYDEVIKDFTDRKYKPIYFFEGEESYFIDVLVEKAEQTILSEAEKEFNQIVLYGRDSSWQQVLENVKSFPFMGAYKVVILKEAQLFKDFEKLESYFEQPSMQTIFIVAHKYKTLDGRSKLAKQITKNKNIGYFKSEQIKEWDVENWIKNHVSQIGYKINNSSAAILKEYLGNNISNIANELSKITLNIPSGNNITEVEIEKYVGISREYNVFEFQKSIGKKDFYKALQFIHYCKANPKANPTVAVIASLYGYFTKIYNLNCNPTATDREIPALVGLYGKFVPNVILEYKEAAAHYPIQKTEKIFSLLQEYDLKSKGVPYLSLSDDELLKELTLKILL